MRNERLKAACLPGERKATHVARFTVIEEKVVELVRKYESLRLAVVMVQP